MHRSEFRRPLLGQQNPAIFFSLMFKGASELAEGALMTTTVNPLTAISTWSIDPAHSSVHFKVRHMMISNVRGEFRTVRGDLKLDETDITQSEIEVEIDISSIHTRDEKRDAHLRSQEFLDTARHPLMIFRSTKVEKVGADVLRVRGDLAMHGIIRNVELDVDIRSE